MVELILILLIIPKVILPLAKVQGRSRFGWVLIAITVYVITKFLIIGIYFFSFERLTAFFGGLQTSDGFWLTSSIDIFATVGGLISIDIIRRYLGRQTLNKIEVPPPPDFLS